ncbi:MAG: hypothetical protein N3E49_03225 [Bacteroidia bacterium]|nr:hypothetical protein [Bacteroidia bacterium]
MEVAFGLKDRRRLIAKHLDEAIKEATVALAKACNLPASGKEDTLTTHKSFLRKLLTRPLNLKRVNKL